MAPALPGPIIALNVAKEQKAFSNAFASIAFWAAVECVKATPLELLNNNEGLSFERASIFGS